MGEAIRLESRHDGFSFDAWREPAMEARRGGLIMLQPIWGVTPHLKELAAEFAAGGYEVLAPSMFDRGERGFPAQNTDMAIRDRRIELAESATDDAIVGDIAACRDALAGPIFLMGFCWGGRAAWLAAGKLEGLACVSAFYPTGVADIAELSPLCPALAHFGTKDPYLPVEIPQRMEALHPEVKFWIYEGAGHAFVAPGADHDEDAARLALLRTRQAFHRAQGKGEMGG